MSHTDRVLKALSNHPALMFSLISTLFSKDVTVASPWDWDVYSGDTRVDPADNCVAQIMEAQGHELHYSWWTWDDMTGNGGTREEAMANADAHLRSCGWVLC